MPLWKVIEKLMKQIKMLISLNLGNFCRKICHKLIIAKYKIKKFKVKDSLKSKYKKKKKSKT